MTVPDDPAGWIDTSSITADPAPANTAPVAGSDGFRVDPDELDQAANGLARASEVLADTESPPRFTGAEVNTNRSMTGRVVPVWLAEYERDWLGLRDRVLRAQERSIQALRESAGAYLDGEVRASLALAAADTHPEQLPPAGTVPAPRIDLSTESADRRTLGGISGGGLDEAVTQWRRRADHTAEALRLVRGVVDGLRWDGTAAEAFTSWTRHHVQRCVELVDRADLARAALHRGDLDPPRPLDLPHQRPALPAASALPGTSVGPLLPDVVPTEIPAPTSPPTSPPVTGSTLHELHGLQPRGEHLDASDDDIEPADIEAADIEAAEPEPAEPVPVAVEVADIGVADLETAPDPVTESGPETAAMARYEVPPAALASTLPVAAAAGVALFARSDRAHHIIRDIPYPPHIGDPTPAGRHPGALLGAGPGRSPLPGLRTPGPTGRALPPDLDDPEPLPMARPMPPVHTTPSTVWINLAAPEDARAWIDLAASRGLGLNGPGAADVARTLWQRLRHDHPDAALIVPEQLAAQLLGHPSPATADPGVLVTPDPPQGLRTAWDEVQRRRTVGMHDRPVVLFAPAPISDTARADLTTTLAHAPSTSIAAVLLGHWEPGTTLTVTEHHQVTEHHHPAPGQPPLTGTHLEPTTLERLTVHPPALPTDPLAPDIGIVAGDADEDRGGAVEGVSEAAGNDDIDPPDLPRPERTPLALTVLGPVQLRYRRPTGEPTDAAAGVEQAEEEVLTVPDISRPGRELLAFLAAHPGGVTRDTIIEAIWPHSAADRSDSAFHTAVSRLRKRIRDTTGTGTGSGAAELIVSADGRWYLNRLAVTVDYWTFLETHPGNRDDQPQQARNVAVRLYTGPFAADLTGEWVHTIRETTRRRFLEAVNTFTENATATDPDLALELLERARNLEPLNEAIYRNIIRIHLEHHRDDAARSTYELLRTHLDTIDAAPEPETERLAAPAHTH